MIRTNRKEINENFDCQAFKLHIRIHLFLWIQFIYYFFKVFLKLMFQRNSGRKFSQALLTTYERMKKMVTNEFLRKKNLYI